MAEDILGVGSGRPVDFASYHVATELIGGGRFASVYRAFDKKSRTDVAIKVYLGTGDSAVAAARAEKETLKRLSDLNTPFFPTFKGLDRVRLKDGWHPAVLMELGEYVDEVETNPGEPPKRFIISLAEVLPGPEGASPPRREVPDFWRFEQLHGWVSELCGAVETLHTHGIVHRDLKPANILLKRKPGDRAIRPFILDFNASVTSESDHGPGFGTEGYLPPEVKTRLRQDPSPVDDLWAVALTLWEVFFGKGCKPDSRAQPHGRALDAVTEQLTAVLLKALELRCEERYATAGEFHVAVHEAVSPPASSRPVAGFSQSELMWMRETAPDIRADMLKVFAGPDEIPVPKEVADRVALLLSGLAQGETQSLNLEADIAELESPAIEAVLRMVHKIQHDTPEFAQVARGLVRLAQQDTQLASRCVHAHFLSSDLSARCLSRRLCEGLNSFPEFVLSSITEDEGVYLPWERMELAEMCLALCKSSGGLKVLTRFMSREYLIDEGSYFTLKERLASRLALLGPAEAATHLVDEAAVHAWEDIQEFSRRGVDARRKAATGLLQLYGDAFAALEEDALALFRAARVPSRCQRNQLSIYRTYGVKLARAYPAAAAWFREENGRSQNRDLEHVVGKLGVRAPVDVRQALDRYLERNSATDYNTLRFSSAADGSLFELLNLEISDRLITPRLRLIVRLLSGMESRRRTEVLDFALCNWDALAAADYKSLVSTLCDHPIQDENLRELAIKRLEQDLDRMGRGEYAHDGLERMLK